MLSAFLFRTQRVPHLRQVLELQLRKKRVTRGSGISETGDSGLTKTSARYVGYYVSRQSPLFMPSIQIIELAFVLQCGDGLKQRLSSVVRRVEILALGKLLDRSTESEYVAYFLLKSELRMCGSTIVECCHRECCSLWNGSRRDIGPQYKPMRYIDRPKAMG